LEQQLPLLLLFGTPRVNLQKNHLTDPPIITHSKVQFYFTNVGEWISDIMRYAIRDLVISRF
jgi:hypothetical protein